MQIVIAAIGVMTVGILIYLSWVLLKGDDQA